MKEPFIVDRAHVAAIDWFTLKRELFSETGSEEEASSILRGIERLGMDPSIVHYECTPNPNTRTYAGAPAVVWSVRAVRQ
jgi:hypothetical protein